MDCSSVAACAEHEDVLVRGRDVTVDGAVTMPPTDHALWVLSQGYSPLADWLIWLPSSLSRPTAH